MTGILLDLVMSESICCSKRNPHSPVGSELHQLLQQGYNIADRDINGKTAKDHAKDSEVKENVDLIGESLQNITSDSITVDQ